MTMPPSRSSASNDVATVLLWGAFAFFIAANFLPLHGENSGIDVWRLWWSLIKSFEMIQIIPAQEFIPVCALLTSALLLLSAPPLMPVFKFSRVMRYLVTLTSGLAFLGFTGFIFYSVFSRPGNGGFNTGSGMVCLVVAQVFNFVGMAFVRSEKAEQPTMEKDFAE